MKLESELNREYAIELSKLILDNPRMRVIAWIDSENISDDYGYWAEKWSDEELAEKAKQIPWEDVIAVRVGVA